VSCNFEAPSVEELAREYEGRVAVVGVGWYGTQDDYRKFVERHSLTFPNVDDSDGNWYQRFSVPYQPAWVFVESSGTFTSLLGVHDAPDLRQRLDALSSGD